MIVTLRLLPREAKALRAMCRQFRFDDAQHLLAGARNVSATNLCEAVTSLLNALADAAQSPQPADIGPRITAETDTHVTLAIAIERAELVKNRQLLEMLLAMTVR